MPAYFESKQNPLSLDLEDNINGMSQTLMEQNLTMLRDLKMPGLAEALKTSYSDDDFCKKGFLEQFNILLSYEITRRANAGYQSRRKKANLVSSATAETIKDRIKDFNLTPSGFEMLMSKVWVEEGKLLLVIGKSGVGKTTLASAVIDAQCRNGLKARCYDYSLLMFKLSLAYRTGGSTEYHRELLKEVSDHDVILLDDVCLNDPRPAEASVMKDLLTECRVRKSLGIICVSQKSPDQWHQDLGGNKIADAVIDRILNRYCLLELDGDSKRSEAPVILTNRRGNRHA